MTIYATWHEFAINIAGVAPADWADWCESEVPAWLASSGASDDTERVVVQAVSRDDARRLLESQLKPGMSINDEARS